VSPRTLQKHLLGSQQFLEGGIEDEVANFGVAPSRRRKYLGIKWWLVESSDKVNLCKNGAKRL